MPDYQITIDRTEGKGAKAPVSNIMKGKTTTIKLYARLYARLSHLEGWRTSLSTHMALFD
jgi:ribosome modulation factor